MRLSWFGLGLFAGWLAFLGVATTRNMPKDLVAGAEWEFIESVMGEKSWLRQAQSFRAGSYIIAVPADSSNASLILWHKENGYPVVMADDATPRGRPADVVVADSRFKSITVRDKDADSVFDSYELATGLGADSLTFFDSNFNGSFDMRLDMAGSIAFVSIDSQWRRLTHREEGPFVDVDGYPRRVKMGDDGSWRWADATTPSP